MRKLSPLFTAVVLLSMFGTVLPGCGNDEPAPTTPIVDLSDADAVALCEEFFTRACATAYPADDPACTGCNPCGQATSLTTLRTECGSGITVGGVRACIDSGFDIPTCTGPQRGGCVFDVADTLCP